MSTIRFGAHEMGIISPKIVESHIGRDKVVELDFKTLWGTPAA
jgi:hypothetical protein